MSTTIGGDKTNHSNHMMNV